MIGSDGGYLTAYGLNLTYHPGRNLLDYTQIAGLSTSARKPNFT